MYAEHSKNLASFWSWERRGESDRQAFQDSGGWGAQFCPQVTDNKPASKGTNQMSSVTDDCDKKTTEYGKRNWSGEARKAA